MALIGYARVSVLEEETWHQHDALEAAGCARIFTDRSSGAHEERPELARCYDHLREGDTLVVTRLDRIGRSLRDLVDTTLALGERGIALRSLDDALDTTGPDGPAVLVICESLAAFELELVRERTALAASGVREPRLGAFVEAARGRPSRRLGASVAPAPAPEAEAPPPPTTRSLLSRRLSASPEAEAETEPPSPRATRSLLFRRSSAPAVVEAEPPLSAATRSLLRRSAAAAAEAEADAEVEAPPPAEPDLLSWRSAEAAEAEPADEVPAAAEGDAEDAESDAPPVDGPTVIFDVERSLPPEPLEPEPPCAPVRRSRGTVRRRALMVVQVGVSVAAAAAAFHVSRSGANPVAEVTLTQTTTNGDVELRFPDGWRRTSADLAVGALRLDDPIVLAQGRTGGSMMMAGLSPATGATLLPAAVLRRLDGAPRPTRVRLGGRTAERYADLRLRGLTRPMTIFVVPTSEGALTLACLAKPQQVAALRSACDRVAQSMLPTRGRAIALGPSARYQEHLNRLVGVLDATRADRRTKLASALTATRQAHLAEELSSAYADARAAGARARVSPREAAAHRRILAAIGDAGGAYERLAAAARADNQAGYVQARSAVAYGERRVRAALAALSRLGYEVVAAKSSKGS